MANVAGVLLVPGWPLLGLLQAFTAMAAGLALAWALHHTWLPVLRTAVANWPGLVRCEQGRFEFPAPQPRLLAEGHDLALVLDPDHRGTVRAPSLLQVQWGRETVRLLGPWGQWEGGYPRFWSFEWDGTAAQAAWQAWEPILSVLLAGATSVGVVVGWYGLAGLYWLPLRLGAGGLGRVTRPGLLWRVALAAQLPGTWFLVASLVAFGVGWVNVLRLGVAFGLHWVISWICLVGLVWVLPSGGSRPPGRGNPFAKALAEDPGSPPREGQSEGRPAGGDASPD
jgi:hypothetical protein